LTICVRCVILNLINIYVRITEENIIMSYINYLNDRRELGFLCLKDIDDIQELENLIQELSTLILEKHPGVWIQQKDNKTFIIVSKKVLVGILIGIKLRFGSMPIEEGVNPPLFPSSEASPSRLMKSNQDYLLKLNGGSDELSNQDQEKLERQEKEAQKRLLKSVLAKAPQSNYWQISPNKLLKPIYEALKAVASNRQFWEAVNHYNKPVDARLRPINPGTTVSPRTPQNLLPKSKGSSSLFVEGLSNPSSRQLSPMQKRALNSLKIARQKRQAKLQLQMAANNLRPDGLSENHDSLPAKLKEIEIKTRRRRQEPLYPSESLGDSYKYGGPQLKRKAPRHLLKDYGIPVEGKTDFQLAVEYRALIEGQLAKPNLDVRLDGILSDKEPAIFMGDPDVLAITIFEKNTLYEDNHFVSNYRVSPESYTEAMETGKLGISDAERADLVNEAQRLQALKDRQKQSSDSLYSNLPPEARMSNQQLREVQALQDQLGENPNFPLTEKQQALMDRASKYEHYKNQYNQNNLDIDRNEF